MKLWLISQNENTGYDTYDSAVVAAETEEEARMIIPGLPGQERWRDGKREKCQGSYNFNDWANTLAAVTAIYLGEAVEGTKSGVVLARSSAR